LLYGKIYGYIRVQKRKFLPYPPRFETFPASFIVYTSWLASLKRIASTAQFGFIIFIIAIKLWRRSGIKWIKLSHFTREKALLEP